MLNDIDESYIYEAGEDLENYHKALSRYGAGGNYRKKKRMRITAAVCAAAAIVGAIVFVNNAVYIRSKRPGVVLSEGEASMPELPIISKPGNTASDTEEGESNSSDFPFAVQGSGDEFHFDLGANNRDAYSDYAEKLTPYETPANATAYTGAKSTAPITVAVLDSNDPEYYNTLTPKAIIKANNETVYMDYSPKTGMPETYEEFVLNGCSRYNITVSGYWNA